MHRIDSSLSLTHSLSQYITVSLPAIIVGSALCCCAGKDAASFKKIMCCPVKVCSIIGLIFVCVGLIGFILVGVLALTTMQTGCQLANNLADYATGCHLHGGRRLHEPPTLAKIAKGSLLEPLFVDGRPIEHQDTPIFHEARRSLTHEASEFTAACDTMRTTLEAVSPSTPLSLFGPKILLFACASHIVLFLPVLRVRPP